MKGLTINKNKGGIIYVNKEYKGRRCFKSTKLTDMKKAEKVAASIFAEFKAQVDAEIEESRVRRVTELIDEFNTIRWKHNNDGAQSYRQAKVFAEIMGDLAVDKIDEKVLLNYRLKLLDKGMHPTTCNRYIAAIRAALNHAFQHRQIAAPPIVVLSKEQSRLRFCNDEELEWMYTNIAKRNGKVGGEVGIRIILFLLETGCRMADALSCTWRQIDMNEDDPRIHFKATKRGNERNIPITDELRDMLESNWRYRSWVGEIATTIIVAEPGARQGKLFPGISRFNVDDAWKWAKTLIDKQQHPNNDRIYAGDKDFVPHTLRHTCASRLAAGGLSLLEIGQMLGHKTYATTLIYAHLVSGHLSKAKEILNAAKVKRGKATSATIIPLSHAVGRRRLILPVKSVAKERD